MLVLLCVMTLLGGCERGNGAVPSGPFNGEKALAYAKEIFDFGPRVPGTEAHRKAGDWIATQMRARADTVIEQRWTHRLANGDSIPEHNILARFSPRATDRILYITHWDSRPVSESAKTEAERKLPVPGANDGASGVGLLMEIADLLKQKPSSYGVDLLFVDGEDYGTFGPPDVDVLIGSTYFADHLPSPDYRPLFGVLFDMIGDADLKIMQETNSIDKADEVVMRVWKTAADLGYANYFVPQSTYAITDDHVPLLARGLHVIDVIDLEYPWHHTPQDTMDKISAHSLKVVGDVAWQLLQ